MRDGGMVRFHIMKRFVRLCANYTWACATGVEKTADVAVPAYSGIAALKLSASMCSATTYDPM